MILRILLHLASIKVEIILALWNQVSVIIFDVFNFNWESRNVAKRNFSHIITALNKILNIRNQSLAFHIWNTRVI